MELQAAFYKHKLEKGFLSQQRTVATFTTEQKELENAYLFENIFVVLPDLFLRI